MRPMFLQLEDESLDMWDQYYFGSYIIVAPLISESEVRAVYLPRGEWVNLWNGKSESGCDCSRLKTMLGLPLVYINKNYLHQAKLVENMIDLLKATPHLTDNIKQSLISPPEPTNQL